MFQISSALTLQHHPLLLQAGDRRKGLLSGTLTDSDAEKYNWECLREAIQTMYVKYISASFIEKAERKPYQFYHSENNFKSIRNQTVEFPLIV